MNKKEYEKLVKQRAKEKRKEVKYGAESHMKSLKVALRRFAKGSDVEGNYAQEHYEKLGWYINQLKKTKKVM